LLKSFKRKNPEFDSYFNWLDQSHKSHKINNFRE
jgi:hypothetical protein